jgi:hypothetical protein
MCCTLIYLFIEDDQLRDDTCGADVMMKSYLRRWPVDLVARPYAPCSRSETYIDVGFVRSAHVATYADRQESWLTQLPAKGRTDTEDAHQSRADEGCELGLLPHVQTHGCPSGGRAQLHQIAFTVGR